MGSCNEQSSPPPFNSRKEQNDPIKNRIQIKIMSTLVTLGFYI